MKYLLPLVILLMGCQATWNPPSSLEKPAPPPTMIAVGTNGSVEWHCELTELNSSLAWVECEFHNTLERAVPSACLTIDFFDENNHNLIVESRKLCSGLLAATDVNTNYAAFQKEQRVTLRKCGEDLGLCVMLAVGRFP